jgi:DNA-directed RNA polymerase sigma subunit (sigma70/sigma32)
MFKYSVINVSGEMSFEEIAKKLNITKQEAIKAYVSGIKKIKHPKLSKKLNDYLKLSNIPENSDNF